jgi:hypothetical protein
MPADPISGEDVDDGAPDVDLEPISVAGNGLVTHLGYRVLH